MDCIGEQRQTKSRRRTALETGTRSLAHSNFEVCCQFLPWTNRVEWRLCNSKPSLRHQHSNEPPAQDPGSHSRAGGQLRNHSTRLYSNEVLGGRVPNLYFSDEVQRAREAVQMEVRDGIVRRHVESKSVRFLRTWHRCSWRNHEKRALNLSVNSETSVAVSSIAACFSHCKIKFNAHFRQPNRPMLRRASRPASSMRLSRCTSRASALSESTSRIEVFGITCICATSTKSQRGGRPPKPKHGCRHNGVVARAAAQRRQLPDQRTHQTHQQMVKRNRAAITKHDHVLCDSYDCAFQCNHSRGMRLGPFSMLGCHVSLPAWRCMFFVTLSRCMCM